MSDGEYVLEVSSTPFSFSKHLRAAIHFQIQLCCACNNNAFDRKTFSFCLHKIFLSAMEGNVSGGFFSAREMYLDRKRSEARDVKKILFGKNRKFDERRCEWNSKNTING
jgi:hypothetical protein